LLRNRKKKKSEIGRTRAAGESWEQGKIHEILVWGRRPSVGKEEGLFGGGGGGKTEHKFMGVQKMQGELHPFRRDGTKKSRLLVPEGGGTSRET